MFDSLTNELLKVGVKQGDVLIVHDGRTIEWPLKPEFPTCSENFGVAYAYLAECGVLRRGQVGQAAVMLMDARKMVAAVTKKLQAEPAWLLCNNFTCEPCLRRKMRLREKGLICGV